MPDSNPFEDLIPTLGDTDSATLNVPIGLVDTSDQPRRHFDDDSLQLLAESISELGIIEPLVVFETPSGRYQLIAGERRLRAAQLAGLEEVPVVLFAGTEEQAKYATLAENLAREDLNPYERARSVINLLRVATGLEEEALKKRLRAMYNARRKKIESDVLKDDIAKTIGKTLETIGIELSTVAQNDLKVLELPKDVLDLLEEGGVSYTAALTIARAPEEIRGELLEMARGGASAADLRKRAAKARRKKKGDAEQLQKRLRKVARALAKIPANQVPDEALVLVERLEKLLGGDS